MSYYVVFVFCKFQRQKSYVKIRQNSASRKKNLNACGERDITKPDEHFYKTLSIKMKLTK